MEKENIIVTKTVEFALEIIAFCEILENNRKFVISNQLLKSGTSIGANIHEAQNAESRADLFIKLKLQPKKLKKQSTGSYYVKDHRLILLMKI